MIARPLDLASRLQPPPRRLDHVFFIAVGLIFVQFSIFDSRFVISSGIPLGPGERAFQVPVTGPDPGGMATTHRLGVEQNGLMFDTKGAISALLIRQWLAEAVAEARAQKQTPTLLILADAGVSTGEITRLYEMALEAKFVGVVVAANRSPRNPP